MADIHEITEGLEDAYFTGSSTSGPPERTGYPVALNGRGYMIDWRSQMPYSRRSVDLLGSQQSQSGGDQAQVPPEIWRRSIESWHQGNGQVRYDREDSLPYRFSASSGVDVWEPWKVSLLHTTGLSKVLTAGTTRVVTIAGYVVVALGSAGYWYSTSAKTWTTCDFTATVIDMTSDGHSVYVLLNDGTVDAWTGPAATTTFMATAVGSFSATASSLAVIKGFLVLSNRNILYDATSGTATLFFTHPNPGFTWHGACDGQSAGYIIGGTGDRWHIFSLVVKNDGTTFDPPTVATTLPDGEIPLAIAEYLGFVLIGSAKGFRLAAADSGGLTYGRLVATDAAVECFEGQDRFVWYGRSGVGGLGRADLSTFTAPLTPAVANDLESGVAGRVGGVVTVGEQRMFVVDGSGAWLEDATHYVTSGYIEMGQLSFGSTDRKQGTYAQVFYDKLIDGGVIGMDYRADGGTWETIGESVSGVTMGNVPLNKEFSTVELRIRLTSNADHTMTPTLSRSETRVLVVPGKASEWTVPLLIFDAIEYEGATENRDVIEDFDFLLGLVQSRTYFQFREGTRVWGVYATDFYWLPQKESDQMRAHQGTFVISLKEVA